MRKRKKFVWVLEGEDLNVVKNAFILKYLQVNPWSSPIPEVTHGKTVRNVLIKMDQTWKNSTYENKEMLDYVD